VFRIIDNCGGNRKVWFDKTYTSSKPGDVSPVKDFYQTLYDMQDAIYDVVTPCEVMDLSTIDQKAYENSEKCYVCSEKFGLNKHNLKNRDHCHKTGLVFIIV
jgi:hypothetical protein